jgi:hypothetical protein
VSSRLAQDRYGRRIAVISVRTLPDVEIGQRFLVLGDTIASGATSVRFYFMVDETRRESRPASPREQLEAQRHAPYRPNMSRQERERQRVPDDELDEAAAVAAAYAEQRRAPADLLNAAV